MVETATSVLSEGSHSGLSDPNGSGIIDSDMITDLDLLTTDLLTETTNSSSPTTDHTKAQADHHKMDTNAIMENLYADITQAKMAGEAAGGHASAPHPYNTRNACWESGSSSSATSSGSHFEFSNADISDIMSDFGMSETIGNDWPDLPSITT